MCLSADRYGASVVGFKISVPFRAYLLLLLLFYDHRADVEGYVFLLWTICHPPTLYLAFIITVLSGFSRIIRTEQDHDP